MADIYDHAAFDFPEWGENFEWTVWEDGTAEIKVTSIESGEVLFERRSKWLYPDTAHMWARGGMVLRYDFIS